MYQIMVGNFWVPEKVSGLGDDAIQYGKLTDDERRAYKGIISFLTFLDSIQTVNLPNLSEYVTSSDVNLLLSIQSFQEAIHSQSYTTILETVVDAKEETKSIITGETTRYCSKEMSTLVTSTKDS